MLRDTSIRILVKSCTIRGKVGGKLDKCADAITDSVSEVAELKVLLSRHRNSL